MRKLKPCPFCGLPVRLDSAVPGAVRHPHLSGCCQDGEIITVDAWNRRADKWRPIESLDRSQMQLVLVAEEGAVRIRLWYPEKKAWEFPEPIGKVVSETDQCSSPTHWMPVPEFTEQEP